MQPGPRRIQKPEVSSHMVRSSRLLAVTLALGLAPNLAAAEQHTIAVVGLVHSHVWGHLQKMVSGKPAKLVGVAESIPELVAEAKKRGVPESLIFADWKKMLDATRPEIVWAFVENNRHLEVAQYCAPRKIHVMFEKPLASTHREALTIRDLAAKHGIQVLTNYQMAWWPANHAAKEIADRGDIGKVWRVRGIVGHGGPGGPTGLNKFFFEWLTDPVKNGAGALVDFGCYNALWALMYLGRPDTVFAHTNQLRPQEFPKVEDNSTLLLSYKGGVAIIEGSWDLPRGFQDLELFGLGGSIYMKNNSVVVQKGRGKPEEAPLKPLGPEAAEPIAAMIHAIETKTAPSGMTGLDLNIQVVEILDAAKQSLKSGRAVRLAAR
jgi:predicted dehydrogenase